MLVENEEHTTCSNASTANTIPLAATPCFPLLSQRHLLPHRLTSCNCTRYSTFCCPIARTFIIDLYPCCLTRIPYLLAGHSRICLMDNVCHNLSLPVDVHHHCDRDLPPRPWHTPHARTFVSKADAHLTVLYVSIRCLHSRCCATRLCDKRGDTTTENGNQVQWGVVVVAVPRVLQEQCHDRPVSHGC